MLGKGRHCGQRAQALGRRHRQCTQPAGADLRVAGGRIDKHERHLAAHHVLDRRCCAAVGHMGQIDARAHPQHLHRQVVRAAGARAGKGHRLRLALGPCDELFDRANRHGRIDHQEQVEAADQADRCQVFFGVVAQLAVKRWIGRQRGGVGSHHHVAIGLGAGGVLSADVGAGAGPVVDDQGLAQCLAHRLGQGAGGHVGAAAGGVGHHPLDRLGRVGLGLGLGSTAQQQGDQTQGLASGQGQHAGVSWVAASGAAGVLEAGRLADQPGTRGQPGAHLG